jgi:hypothetical protein
MGRTFPRQIRDKPGSVGTKSKLLMMDNRTNSRPCAADDPAYRVDEAVRQKTKVLA